MHFFFFKEFRKDSVSGRAKLISLNPNYSDIAVTPEDGIRAIGRVLCVADKNLIEFLDDDARK